MSSIWGFYFGICLTLQNPLIPVNGMHWNCAPEMFVLICCFTSRVEFASLAVEHKALNLGQVSGDTL